MTNRQIPATLPFRKYQYYTVYFTAITMIGCMYQSEHIPDLHIIHVILYCRNFVWGLIWYRWLSSVYSITFIYMERAKYTFQNFAYSHLMLGKHCNEISISSTNNIIPIASLRYLSISLSTHCTTKCHVAAENIRFKQTFDWQVKLCMADLQIFDLIHQVIVITYGDRSKSALAEVMACCLRTPSHFPNQYQIIILKSTQEFDLKDVLGK